MTRSRDWCKPIKYLKHYLERLKHRRHSWKRSKTPQKISCASVFSDLSQVALDDPAVLVDSAEDFFTEMGRFRKQLAERSGACWGSVTDEGVLWLGVLGFQIPYTPLNTTQNVQTTRKHYQNVSLPSKSFKKHPRITNAGASVLSPTGCVPLADGAGSKVH